MDTNESSVKADKSPSFYDYNQDGYPDFLWHDWALNRLKVKVWDPAQGGFESTDTTGTALRTGLDADEDYYFTLDVNGDGNADLAYYHEDTFETYLNEAAGRPNLITAISNGLGATTSISYEPLSTTDAYTRAAGVNTTTTTAEHCFSWQGSTQFCWPMTVASLDIASFYEALNDPFAGLNQPVTGTALAPVLELMGPLYVVTRVDGSAPVAGAAAATSAIQYAYEQAKLQAAGRGLLGFQALTTVDLQRGVRTTTSYRQDFPYIGYPVATEVVDAAGHVLRTAANTWQLQGYANTWDDTAASSGTAALGPLQPYLQQSIERTYDLPVDSDEDGETEAGAALSAVTTTSVVDAYGNPTQITVTTRDTVNTKRFEQVTANVYGDTVWAQSLGRLTETTVTSKRDEDDDGTYEKTATRVAGFTYYTTGDLKGLLKTEVREPDAAAYTHTTTYSYDAHGNRVRAALGTDTDDDGVPATRCDTDTATYERYGRYAAQTRDCLGRLTADVLARDAYGQPEDVDTVIDTDGVTSVATHKFYTPRGRLYYTWDERGAYSGTILGACPSTAASAACPTGAAYYAEVRRAGGAVEQTYYDVLARAVRTRTLGLADPDSADVDWVQTDTDYDASGRVARRTEPYYDGDVDVYWTVFSYDLLGRITETTLPDHVAGATDSTVTVSYDGLSTETKNAGDQVRLETRNALGEIIEVDDNLGTSVTYAYDAQGRLTGTSVDNIDVTAVTTTMTYDRVGRKVSLADPDQGSWSYAYNGFDELTRQTDALGNDTRMSYDGLGRLLTRDDYESGESTAAGSADWTYDTAANGLGQLASVTDGSVTRTVSYDALGRPDITTTTLGDDGSYYAKQTYDGYGRPFQAFDGARSSAAWDSHAVETRYDAHGYAVRWVDGVYEAGAPKTVYRKVKGMDARGNVTREWLGNGVTTVRRFAKQTGRIDSLVSEDSLLNNLQDLHYTWDVLGNLSQRVETSGDKALTEDFTYDTLNRLTGYTVGTSARTVLYDSAGNLTTKSDVGAYSYGAGTAGPHALTGITFNDDSSTTFTYDANGNQLSGDGRTLTYTLFNKVKQIVKGSHTTTFAYGPERTRTKRTDTVTGGTATTLYLGTVEKIIQPGGSYVYKRYIGGVVIETRAYDSADAAQGPATTEYLLTDHLGSLDVITDASAGMVQDLSFDAWGQRRNATDWSDLSALSLSSFDTDRTTRGYTGHEMVDATGIIHMNGRIYDPKLGRFLQADPIIQFPGFTQSYNRYTYVLNNPLAYTDPSGYFLKKLFRKLVGAVVNGIFGELLASKVPALRPFFTLAHCVLGDAFTCAAGAFGNTYAAGGSCPGSETCETLAG